MSERFTQKVGDGHDKRFGHWCATCPNWPPKEGESCGCTARVEQPSEWRPLPEMLVQACQALEQLKIDFEMFLPEELVEAINKYQEDAEVAF